MIPISIPSPPPEWSTFNLGPLTIHIYALFILVGIFFALWWTTRRWEERGGRAEVVGEIGLWAIPFGIIGGRIYHVISTPGPYFGEGGNPVDAFKIWEGGLGIWGAVAFGALGAYIGARRHHVSFTAFMDAAAPAVLVAQAIGRLGNYFNQELFGRPTDLPWALEIDPAFRPDGYEQYETFHPTFLYEMIWALAGAVLLVYLDRKLDLRGGRVFWLYVIVYVSGRLWIETVRIDEAVQVAGLRINVWVSIAVLTLGIVMFWMLGVRQRAAGEWVPRHLLAADGQPGDDATAADAAPESHPDTDPDTTVADEKAAETKPSKATKPRKPSTSTKPRKPGATAAAGGGAQSGTKTSTPRKKAASAADKADKKDKDAPRA